MGNPVWRLLEYSLGRRRWWPGPGWWPWRGGMGLFWTRSSVRATELDEKASGMPVAREEVWGLSPGPPNTGAREDEGAPAQETLKEAPRPGTCTGAERGPAIRRGEVKVTLTGTVSVEEWGQTSQGQKTREVEAAKYRQHI